MQKLSFTKKETIEFILECYLGYLYSGTAYTKEIIASEEEIVIVDKGWECCVGLEDYVSLFEMTPQDAVYDVDTLEDEYFIDLQRDTISDHLSDLEIEFE